MRRRLSLGIFFCMAWSLVAVQAQAMEREVYTYTLGPGGDYATFTQAIQYLNGLPSIPAPGITFLVSVGATFNENPPSIMRSASEAAPVVFQKSGEGENPQVLATGGSGSADAVFRLNSVSYYTFDGIDVANAGSSIAMEFGYFLFNGSRHNTIKNSKISLSRFNTRSKGVYALSTPSGLCQYNLYQNLEIDDVVEGVYLFGSSSIMPSYETVQDCVITNAVDYGIRAPFGVNLQILNNRIAPVSGGYALFSGIFHGGAGSSTLVEGNRIESDVYRGNFFGINHRGGEGVIRSNYLGGITFEGPDAVGISISAGNVTVSQNTITGFASLGGSLIGIDVSSSAGNSQVLGNLISNFSCVVDHYYGSFAAGMILGGANCLAANNMIQGMNFSSRLQPSSIGIRTVQGNIRLYYNTIRLAMETSLPTSSSACIQILVEGEAVELINNILANCSTPGSSGKAVGIWKSSDGFTGLSEACSNNLFWLDGDAGNYLVAQIGSTGYQSLAEYQAASGREQDSHFDEPVFVSAGDLHLDAEAECAAKDNARPLAAVSVDFDGEPRDVQTPDIGADEVVRNGESEWEISATELDFGYVCSGESPGVGSLTISNLGAVTLVFDASCFTLEGSACFELLDTGVVVPAFSTAELQLSFGGAVTGEKVGSLIISKAGISRTVSLSGMLNAALEMPVKANWEAGFEGWIPVDIDSNKWQISTEQSYKDDAALVAVTAENSLIHLFADVVLPASSPRLIVNLLHSNVGAQDFSLWLVETNYTPQVGSLPSGLQLSADLGAADRWNRVVYSIPASYAGQTVRLVLSFNATIASRLSLDNLRVLGAVQQPSTPQQVQFIRLAQGAKITWQTQVDANEYLVEASTESSHDFYSPLQSTGNTELTVSTDGARCFYRVIAFE